MTTGPGSGYPPASNPDPGSPGQWAGYSANDPLTGQPLSAAPAYQTPPADAYPPSSGYPAASPPGYPAPTGYAAYAPPPQPGYAVPGQLMQPGQPPFYPMAGQTPPGYPAGYPMVPVYGYPQAQGSGRPGTVTAAAVLAFVQAGFAILGGITVFSLSNAALNYSDDDDDDFDSVLHSFGTEGIVVGILILIAAGLLITGGVQVLARKNGVLMVGALLSIAVSVFFVIFFSNHNVSSGVWLPILYAVMPILALTLGYGGSARKWIREKAA